MSCGFSTSRSPIQPQRPPNNSQVQPREAPKADTSTKRAVQEPGKVVIAQQPRSLVLPNSWLPDSFYPEVAPVRPLVVVVVAAVADAYSFLFLLCLLVFFLLHSSACHSLNNDYN
jgi:hypothetical protein